MAEIHKTPPIRAFTTGIDWPKMDSCRMCHRHRDNGGMTQLSHDWRSHAECAGLTHVFYPTDDSADWETAAEAQSKQICQNCPVIDLCLSDELNGATERKKLGNRYWITQGVVGGANRYERQQMMAGGEKLAGQLVKISNALNHAEAQELRAAWEVEGPPANEIEGLTDEEIAALWGSTPDTARSWRIAKGIIKPRGIPAWKERINDVILEVLSDGQPHRRQEVRDAAAAAIPHDKLEAFAERVSVRLGTHISDSRAATHMTNHYLHTLGESRKGLIRVWEDEDGERWVAAVQQAA